ncbi:M15 family metallopeptidase [Halobacillus mangrovi]|uniref:M15 family metallopeptidase n=1 Tax=Halobacillus mangrovi TaxID=402384 RepID=UPI003D99CD12
MKKYMVMVAVLSLSLSACSLGADQEGPNASESSSTSKKEVEEKAEPTFNPDEPESENSDSDHQQNNSNESQEQSNANMEEKTQDGLTVVADPQNVQVVVNKQRKLPDGYIPPDLTVPDVPFYFDEDLPKKQMRKEAAKQLEQLFAGAKKAEVELVAASGYRSYERQKRIFQGYVEEHGEKKANTFSAKPGTSEHQTGLAMDVTSAKMSFQLDQSFRQTEEGEWLANHAHEYGFIIRYPKGKDAITGYTYEPWHLRYVGKDISSEIHNQSLTLEEFFGFQPAGE